MNHWMVGNLIRKAIRKDTDKLGILYYPQIHKIDKLILSINQNFYIPIKESETNLFDGLFNVNILPNGIFPPGIDYDLIVSFYGPNLKNGLEISNLFQLNNVCFFNEKAPNFSDKFKIEIQENAGAKIIATSQEIADTWPIKMPIIDVRNLEQINKLFVETANENKHRKS